jgi:excisionase family DNA binding protein
MATIGEVARRLGVSSDSIRRWEDEGKIPKPRRTCGGWRTYTDSEIDELKKAVAQHVEGKQTRG